MGTVLDVRDLTVELRRKGRSAAPFLKGISFSVGADDIFCLVGESGSGKSLTALTLFNALPEGFRLLRGSIVLNDEEIAGTPRGRERMAYVFQDPSSALNPVFTVGQQLGSVARVRGKAGKEEILKVLRAVAIPDPRERLKAFPHEFSGGMQQRLVVSMALLTRPVLLVADEPTTALDLTVQDKVLRLLKDIRDQGTAILLITHDFGVVADTATRVGVMYAGYLVETASAPDLFAKPLHPYTRLLLGARPSQGFKPIPGEVPSLLDPPPGCPFHPRCPHAMPKCTEAFPPASLRPGREVSCHLYDAAP